jgi:hypothetical protein
VTRAGRQVAGSRLARLLLGLACLATACGAAAQSSEPSELRLTLYFWIAGFEGTVGAADGGGRVDADFSGLLDNLELGGFMLHADWRMDRWTLFGDWSHFKVSSEAPSPFGAAYAGVDAEIKGNVAQAALGYRVLGSFDSGVDAFAGLRFYDLEARMTLQPGALAARNLSGSDQWVDGIIGARWRGRPSRDWTLSVYGDIGAGGSDRTWQAAATVSYEFSWGAVTGGWRHLYVDYETSGLKLDAALSGPFVGATLRF